MKGSVGKGVRSDFNFRLCFYLFLIPYLFFLNHPSFSADAPEAPAFRAEDLRGQLHSLEQYRGRPLVLYFWATWCPGCRRDVTNIQKIYTQYREKGIGFVTVSLDTQRSRLENFVEEQGLPYPVLFDGKGWNNKIARRYGIVSTPTFVLIDSSGRIRATGHWSGELVRHLEKL